MNESFAALTVLDIETGGLEHGVPVIEVAYGPVFCDQLTLLWNTSARPEDCNPRALELNRCFERGPGDAEQLDERALAARVAADLADKVIVAANPQFDCGHLAHLLARFGIGRAPWSYRLVDLKSLAVGFAAASGRLREMPSGGWGQADVAALVGVEALTADVAHSAAGDVLQLRQIVRRVLAGVS